MATFVVSLLFLALVQAAEYKPAYVEPIFKTAKTIPQSHQNVKITGGEEVEPHSIPWQVGLLVPTDEGTILCGGSLISTTTVLSSAYCAELLISDTIEIVLGAHNISKSEDTQIRINSSEVIIHPKWDNYSYVNNIAILRIADPVNLNENIDVVPLPTRANENKTYLDDLATASGWGKASDEATIVGDVLRKVEIPVQSNDYCYIYYLGLIKETNICCSGKDGKSTCHGDSGGPLVASTGELIGTASFGASFSCQAGWSPVFTRVSKYLDWIEDNSDVVIN